MGLGVIRSFAKLLFITAFIFVSENIHAQSLDEGIIVGGLEFTFLESENFTQETAQDILGFSPDRVIRQNYQSNRDLVTVDGPRENVEDIYKIAWSQGRRKKSVVNPLGHVTKYLYNEEARLIRKIDPNGTKTEIEYNTRGQVTNLKYGVGSLTEQITKLAYDDMGYVSSISLPDGRYISQTRGLDGKDYTFKVK